MYFPILNRFFIKKVSIMLILFLFIFLLIKHTPVVNAGLPCDCLEDRILILQNPQMQGEDVILLQERLKELGFYQGPLDGIYDIEMARSVADFQAGEQLEVDGEVDAMTWDALGDGVVPANCDENKEAPAGEISIVINTYKRTLTLYSDGEVFKTYPCAIGKPSTKSPIGEWAIISKSKDWGGGFGTRWLGLNVPWGIYGIHGTNKPWSIGRAASHGCIRMYNRDIEELFEWAPLKTRVEIIGERLPVNVNRPLNSGQMGLSVMQLQDNLNKYGFDSGYRDARYGPTTEESVKELEAQYGLRIDGKADWNILYLLDLPGKE
ncbi:MAG: L,D-transpeptidase family protein [Halanaerobiaceae bacterium]